MLAFCFQARAQTPTPTPIPNSTPWASPTPIPAAGVTRQLNDADLRRDVARFLTQATFGPTKAEIDTLTTTIQNQSGTNQNDRIKGYTDWINTQLSYPQTKMYDFAWAADKLEWRKNGVNILANPTPTYDVNLSPTYNNRRHAWWTVSLQAQDQLRQRVTFALSEILVVSSVESTLGMYHYGICNYYDTLGSFVNSGSGTYRDILSAVSVHPVMGQYLSHLRNDKTRYAQVLTYPDLPPGPSNPYIQTTTVISSPDENYAREIMQLFSIGLNKLHIDGVPYYVSDGQTPPTYVPVPAYTQNDVTEMAKVMTGWGFSVVNTGYGGATSPNNDFNYRSTNRFFQSNWTTPMKAFSDYHEPGTKTLLSTTISGTSAPTDLNEALNVLCSQESMAPFISKQLIERFVTSNPSRGYVARVAKVFNDTGGSLKAVITAILTDYDARTLSIADDPKFGKQKEPIVRYVQMLRALGGHSGIKLSQLNTYDNDYLPQYNLFPNKEQATMIRHPESTANLGQSPFAPPSVFNWFYPDYSPSGVVANAGLVAPEMQLSTETMTYSQLNYFLNLTSSTNGKDGIPLPVRIPSSGTSPVSNPGNGSEDISLDFTILTTVYGNARLQNGQTEQQANETLLDYLDYVLMAGDMKYRYSATHPTNPTNPRDSILNAINGMTFPSSTERVEEMLYMVIASPTYIHQK